MEEKIIQSDTWSDTLLYPYHVVKNYLSDKKFTDDIQSKLNTAQTVNNRPGAENKNEITGACEIVIPGVGFRCEKGLTELQCQGIITELQKDTRGVWGKFRPGGQCSQ